MAAALAAKVGTALMAVVMSPAHVPRHVPMTTTHVPMTTTITIQQQTVTTGRPFLRPLFLRPPWGARLSGGFWGMSVMAASLGPSAWCVATGWRGPADRGVALH